MDNVTNISKSTGEDNAFAPTPTTDGWYVCRYRMVTQEILKLETLQKPNLTIFLPITKRVAPNQSHNTRNCRPVVPGFIFVKGKLRDIRDDFDLGRYRIMRTHSGLSRPVIISDREMEGFMKVAAILTDNTEVIYAEEFDQATHNIAEFRDSDGELNFAFLETLQGVSGGRLIVPIRQDEIATAVYRKIDLADFRLPPRALCYKLPAADVPYALLHIARGNKYDLDYINTADKKATTILRLMAASETVTDKTLGKMRECFLRYRKTKTESVKFQARISLLLYKCSLILHLDDEMSVIRQRIEESILPSYKEYVQRVRKDKRPQTQKAFEQFLQKFEHTVSLAESIP